MTTKFDNLTYHEILDVPVRASALEIREAYKEALSLYDGDALITYSLFDEDERGEILQKIDEAFQTLTDEEKREAYERFLLKKGKIDPDLRRDKASGKAVPLFPREPGVDTGTLLNRIKEKIREKAFRLDTREALSKEGICGGDLKKIRESLGVELQEVFEVTRVNVTTLKALEGDCFEKLPPMIYLKNFLKAYAELLDLKPKKISEGYLGNMSRHDRTGKQ